MPSSLEALRIHGQALLNTRFQDLFKADKERFSRLSFRLDDLLVDFSKCHITTESVDLLCKFARQSPLESRRAAMISGQPINETEKRPALHMLLRAEENSDLALSGLPLGAQIAEARARLYDFSGQVRAGARRGATGKPIKHIVNIGIGGSDLGPQMAIRALRPYHDGPSVGFISNADGAHAADELAGLDPATVLFIVSSKTFSTAETLLNARTARAFISENLGEAALSSHFVVASARPDRAQAFGIDPQYIFPFWDWVGGRYSLWSSVGLAMIMAIGAERFNAFLAGAAAMDHHFIAAPFEENIPVLMGLIGFWHRSIMGYPTRAVLPYDQRLEYLPAYLQQLDMESNGKSVTMDGQPVMHDTGPVLWGSAGTNGQHAYFQSLHQGTQICPCEFLIAANPQEPEKMGAHHKLLLANFLAQSQALLQGRSQAQTRRKLAEQGLSQQEIDRLAPHQSFAGNRPSLSIIYDRLTPYALGRLIALYEHRVFVEAALWGINPFDQWGVELGKELAGALAPAFEGRPIASGIDGSTAGLCRYLLARRGEGEER